MNITGLAVLAVFLLCIWDGWRKGLVKKLNSILAVIISSVLVWALLPAVTSFLKNSTPVYEAVVQVCETTVSSQFGDTLVSRMSGSANASGNSSSSAADSRSAEQGADVSASGTGSADGIAAQSDYGSAGAGSSDTIEVIQVNPTGWSRRTKDTAAAAVHWIPTASGQISVQQTSSLSDALNSSGTYDRETIRNIMNQYGLDGSRLDSMTDAQITEYVQQYLSAYLNEVGQNDVLSGAASSLSQVSGLLNNLTKIEQTKLIQSLPVPGSLRKILLNYNNSEGYRTLGASSFADYLIRFIANVIMNILAFLITMLLVNLIVRAILGALDIIARIPGIYLINRAGGLAAGLVQGVFVVWCIFLLVSLFSGTDIGMYLLDQIDSSIILKPLYQSNAFLKIITNAIHSIM